MRSFHSSGLLLVATSRALTTIIVAAALVSVPASARAQQPDPTESTFSILLRGTAVGTETVSVERGPAGWTIRTTGRTGPPLDYIGRDVRFRYSLDWKPLEMTIDAVLRGQPIVGRTTIDGTSARNVVSEAGRRSERTEAIAADAVFLPTPVWGSFEALSRRLLTAAPGSTIPAYTLQGSFAVQVGETITETLQTTTRTTRVRRTSVRLGGGAQPLEAEVWSTDAGRLLRLSIPAQTLDVVSEEISSVAVRRVVVARDNDEEVRFLGNGFTLAAKVSKPLTSVGSAAGPDDKTSAQKLKPIILVAGAGAADRDENAFGIPIFGEMAGALADAGYLVVRFDKRGVGQSGGRVESATLDDFAEDVLAVVKGVRSRKDVDDSRVTVVGYGDGASIAMLAARRSNDIDALVLLAAAGVPGAELNLWQAQHALARSTQPQAEREATLALQKQIQAAVMSGTGWDAVPPQIRRQADTPWFKSVLTFDPGTVIPKLDQPILIVHGQLDTQVPPGNADALESLAAKRKDKLHQVVKLPGINHLFVPATTGEADEYPTLKDAHVSEDVTRTIADWLAKIYAPARPAPAR